MNKTIKLDASGRIVIPSEMIKELQWGKSSPDAVQFVNMTLVDDTLVITKDVEKRCTCGYKLNDRFKYCPDCGKKVQ
jgi:hypothetical protein